MKPLRILFVLLLVIGAWLAWRYLPGLRAGVSNTVQEYGGWTEEARTSDPVGFIEFAEEKLAADLVEFRASLDRLAEARANAVAEKERNAKLLAAAEDLAARFKARFQVAEIAGKWPIEYEGAGYTRDQFVEQVENILSEGETARRVMATYDEVVETAELRARELKERIRESEATQVELKAQKELVRVETLTAKTDELLSQVDDLLGENSQSLEATPVRSVEALLAATQNPTSSGETRQDALEFLKED